MMAVKSFVFRFDDVEVREREFSLTKAGKVLTVEPKAFRALLFLLHNPQRLISKEELLNSVWGDAAVTEGSLTRCIWLLRSVLGDDIRSPRYIETVATVGYRFICPVEVSDEASGEPEATETPTNSIGFRGKVRRRERLRGWALASSGILALVLAAAIWFLRHPPQQPRVSGYTQITAFSDGATSPVFSPDGRMIAFIRGPETFVTPGQIYVKMLPDGEPVQLTHDFAPKLAPAFSPDGSRIAYTATDKSPQWNTWVVPVLGGGPRELLPNAAALTWVDKQHVVFSEMRPRYYMGIATATENREGERDVYLPAGWGMAHRSWVSPDGKWILVSEMDGVGWQPCRVLPFDGSTRGVTAGPKAASCTYGGWSPDGKTMYFSVDAGDGYHIWRQRFPEGIPEQITFGPTEEEGVAVSPDGHSLVTSAGIRESTVWVHDAQGDRQISGEGFAVVPGLGFGTWIHSVFSPDGKRLYYLVRKQGSRAFLSGELWMADLDSGRTEAVMPGVSMSEFDIAPDGKRVAFTALDAAENPHVWLAPLDRHGPPKQLTSSIANDPHFVPGGEVYFYAREGDRRFLYSIGPDESAPRKLPPGPHSDPGASSAFSGRIRYVRIRGTGEMGSGMAIAISLPAGKELPKLPPSELTTAKDLKGLNVVAEIDMKGKTIFAPGPNPSVYAYVRATIQRNLFRIPLQ